MDRAAGGKKTEKAPPAPSAFIGAAHAVRESVQFDSIYELGDELGTGAMSVVRVATRRSDGMRLAAKCIAKEPLNLEDEEALMQEVNILQQLDHPNIVKLHGFFDEATMFYLVMDLIEGGELFERIVQKEFYSEKEARDLIRILVDTIKYCHDQVSARHMKYEHVQLTNPPHPDCPQRALRPFPPSRLGK